MPGDSPAVDKEPERVGTELSEPEEEEEESTAVGAERSFGERMQDARKEKAQKKAARGANLSRGNAGRKRKSADEAVGDGDERVHDEGKSTQKKLKLTLPIHKFAKALRGQSHTRRVGGGTAVMLTSIIEYVTSEILELAGNTAKEGGKIRIVPKHIQQAVRTDEELNKYFADVTIAGAGVVPQVHVAALPKRDKRPKAREPAAADETVGVLADSGSQVY